MPQQLIYTSAPRGVIAGRSGHCTVARSGAMREALMLQLEKLSYYQHLSLSGGQERPIFCCRVLDLRGSRYHVLTRIHDAGLDFTGRTNFLAHHLIFTPEEVRQFPSPPVILREWSGWLKSWNKDPELFENENWSSLAELAGQKFIPATHWQQLTGDATNGYGLLEARAGIAFRVDDLSDEQILALFAESLELLEFRDPRRDFRASAWQYTFTTSMQEQDNPPDFRWRCLHLDNPAANRFAGPDTRALSEVRATRVTNEETIFARAGRQSPRFTTPPQNVNCAVGETARLFAKAEGVPSPAYQWFAVDRAGNRQPIAGATAEELSVQNPPLGITRYVIRASNSQGEIISEVVTLSVDPKGTTPRPANPGKPPGAPHIKSASEIEQQRQRLEQGQKPVRKLPWMLLGILFIAGMAGAIFCAILWKPSGAKTPSLPPIAQRNDADVAVSNSARIVETPEFKKNADTTPAPVTKPTAHISLPFQTSVGPLPPPWKAVQIGKAVTVRTAANIDRSEFLIFGAGENNDNRSDNFFFVRRPMSNSVDFQAELKEAQWLPQRRQGIMIRDSENVDAPFAFVGTFQDKLSWIHRDLPAQYAQLNVVPSVHLPVFLRLLKRTNIISAAYSMTGSNWIWLETNEIPFSSRSCLIGFAVSSGDAGQQAGATFDAVTINNH